MVHQTNACKVDHASKAIWYVCNVRFSLASKGAVPLTREQPDLLGMHVEVESLRCDVYQPLQSNAIHGDEFEIPVLAGNRIRKKRHGGGSKALYDCPDLVSQLRQYLNWSMLERMTIESTSVSVYLILSCTENHLADIPLCPTYESIFPSLWSMLTDTNALAPQ